MKALKFVVQDPKEGSEEFLFQDVLQKDSAMK